MDLAAAELGMDPVEMRRRNLIAPRQMPYRTAIGETYDCGEFEPLLDQALALADWKGFEARKAEAEKRERRKLEKRQTFRMAEEAAADGDDDAATV